MKENEDVTVIDFADLPTVNDEEFLMMEDEALDQHEIYCDFIQLATSIPEGATIESDYHCLQVMDDGELCEGDIEVFRTSDPKQVRWRCISCGHKGAIINYEKSQWDNSELTESDKKAFITQYSLFSGDYDHYSDMLFGIDDELAEEPLHDFEYYLNPYDPGGYESGVPGSAVLEEMLNCDWKKPGSPVYLRDDLSWDELKECDFFYNARQFLVTLDEEGEFELTRNHFLKRKTVSLLLEKTRWPEGEIARLRKFNQYIDETDVWTLHGIRLLVDIAELTDPTDDNRYRLFEPRKDLLKKENAGKLYRTLFTANFKEMNMAFMGTQLEVPHLQHSIPFIIYQLISYARDWTLIDELILDIFLFSVKVELDVYDVDGFNISADILSEDLFASLERFGLVNTRRVSEPDPDEPIDHPDQVRITPLLEKFVEFNI